MTKFLLELYVATVAGADVDVLAKRARAAAESVSAAGRTVRFLQAILVPTEETCFLLFEADEAETVHDAAARAELPPGRISEAVTDHAPTPGAWVRRRGDRRTVSHAYEPSRIRGE